MYSYTINPIYAAPPNNPICLSPHCSVVNIRIAFSFVNNNYCYLNSLLV